MIDLGRTLLGAAERYPDREAIVDGPTRWTYGKWFECVCHVAGGLVELGLRPGDHLVTILKNRWQTASLHWACQLTGVVITPINWRAKPGEIDFVLSDAEAKAVAFEMATEVAVNDTVLGPKMPRSRDVVAEMGIEVSAKYRKTSYTCMSDLRIPLLDCL